MILYSISLGIIHYNDVVLACKLVSADWKHLGTRLGVLVHALNIIEANCNGSVESCFEAMIAKWLQRPIGEVKDDVRPTWKSLCEALAHINRPLVETIAGEHDCGSIGLSGLHRLLNLLVII